MSEKPKIQRVALKISNDATFEEMQAAIRAAMDDPTFQLNREEFDAFKSLDQVERERRQKMIEDLGPLYQEYVDRDDPEGLKRKKEMNDILHYIQFAGEGNWKIIKMQESPDFVIEVGGEMIGLELTGFYDMGTVAQVNKRGRVCAKAEEDLRAAYSEMSGLVNVFFEPEKSKSLREKEMISELSGYLEATLRGEKREPPAFVTKVDIRPQGKLQIVLAENYFVKDINTEALDDLIAQKEAKLAQYKANTGLSTIWLLVVIDGVSQKSAPVFTPENLPQRRFAFDRVIIYNSFKDIGIATPSPC